VKTEFIIEPDRQDIVMKRVFDAPPEAVFEAFTDPRLVARWLGPREYETAIDRWAPEPGGSWRYVHRAEDREHGFHGVFHEVRAPHRIVQTFEWEGLPGHVSLETATFRRTAGGGTELITVAVYQSVEDRDGMAASGMREGVEESYDRLAELVEAR